MVKFSINLAPQPCLEVPRIYSAYAYAEVVAGCADSSKQSEPSVRRALRVACLGGLCSAFLNESHHFVSGEQ